MPNGENLPRQKSHPLIPLVPDEFAAVGRFILVWNVIETEIENIVGACLDLKPPAIDAIMWPTNVSPKVDIMLEIIRSRFSGTAVEHEAEKCAKNVKKHSNFRNSVAHGRWVTDLDTNEIFSVKNFSSRDQVTIDKINAKHDELLKLHYRLTILRLSIHQRERELIDRMP